MISVLLKSCIVRVWSVLTIISSFQAARIDVSINPNPANKTFSLQLDLNYPVYNMAIVLYDSKGNFINELYSGQITKGRHVFDVDANTLSAGVYYCYIITDNFSHTEKLIIK
ncbi:MAG: T9SS type A sorting domain-containing protein [Candidatus Kapaibacterium sp.]